MTRRRTSLAIRTWQAVGTVLIARSVLFAAFYGIGWLLGDAGKAVGVR